MLIAAVIDDVLPWGWLGTQLATTVDVHKDATSGIAEDRRAVDAALRGDENAYAELIARYQATIARQMVRFSRDPGIIEELTHEAFVQAYLSLKSYRGSAPFIHWLRKVAVRVGYRYWKKRDKERERTAPLTDFIGEIEAFEQDRLDNATRARELLGDLLQYLSPRDRLVLTLLYWDGYSMAEAAHLAGWSVSMVKVQAHRARNRLRKLIEEEMR